MTIPLMRSTFMFEAETRQALAEFILHAPKLSMGEQCAKFERTFAAWQGREYAVLFNSGGSANLALLQALKNLEWLHSGDNVGFSALTWSTNVMPILQLGMYAVPVDVRPDTLNVMSEQLTQTLERINLDALFITNALGLLPDLDNIRDICTAKGIMLLEDNCESLGSRIAQGMAGNFGLASTFSFFVAHHLSTIEGGMVCTDNRELAEMLVIVRANGWDRNLDPVRQALWRAENGVSDFEAAYTFYDLGFNLRPTEITGFLGNEQLKYLTYNIGQRAARFWQLQRAGENNPDLCPLWLEYMVELSPFAYPVVCETPTLRTQYVKAFQAAGVEVRPLIAGNIQRQPFYRRYCTNGALLYGAEYLHDRGFYFGCHPDLTPEEIDLLCSLLRGERCHS